MEIFLDSADTAQISKWLAHGLVDGVTTNPTILLKDGGYDMERRAKEIAELINPLPLSVEVFSNNHDEMLEQAGCFAGWAPNIVIKIPVINEQGESSLDVVKTLIGKGVRVNLTACLSFGHVIGGAKAGATYISLFAGRMADEGQDTRRVIRESVEWLKMWGYSSKILVGSIREVSNITDAALAGAHIITIPPQFLEKLIDHQYSRATVRQFNEDAQSARKHMQNQLLVGRPG